MGELDRIAREYERRDHDGRLSRQYSYFDPANLFIVQSRERVLLHLLQKHRLDDLAALHILDVGCGTGNELRNLVQYGADPAKLCGIDLMPERIAEAQRLSPNIAFICGSAEELPYNDATFDLVLQFTVFTSILDTGMRRRVAQEMMRVLKPGGAILWYDFWASNPRNPAVRGIGLSEIKRLFPGCYYDLRRTTLAPPLARLLAKRSTLLCALLERTRFLCTHYLGLIKGCCDEKNLSAFCFTAPR